MDASKDKDKHFSRRDFLKAMGAGILAAVGLSARHDVARAMGEKREPSPEVEPTSIEDGNFAWFDKLGRQTALNLWRVEADKNEQGNGWLNIVVGETFDLDRKPENLDEYQKVIDGFGFYSGASTWTNLGELDKIKFMSTMMTTQMRLGDSKGFRFHMTADMDDPRQPTSDIPVDMAFIGDITKQLESKTGELKAKSWLTEDVFSMPEGTKDGIVRIDNPKLETLYTGDVVFTPDGRKMLVVAAGKEKGKPVVELMGFGEGKTHDKTGLYRAKSDSMLAGWADGPISVVRTEKADETWHTWELRQIGLRFEKDIPEEIRNCPFGQTPAFENIPEVLELRKELTAAKTTRQREIAVSKLVGILGLRVKDEETGAEVTGKRFIKNKETGEYRRNACNVYLSQVLAIMYEDPPFSHFVDGENRPVIGGGREMTASESARWMSRYARERGCVDTRGMTAEQLHELTKKGYILIGLREEKNVKDNGHSWIITNGEKTGGVMPVVIQATADRPQDRLDPENPFDPYKCDGVAERTDAETELGHGMEWAVPLPGVEVDEDLKPLMCAYAPGWNRDNRQGGVPGWEEIPQVPPTNWSETATPAEKSRVELVAKVNQMVQEYRLSVGTPIEAEHKFFRAYLKEKLSTDPTTSGWAETEMGQKVVERLAMNLKAPEVAWRKGKQLPQPLQCVDVAAAGALLLTDESGNGPLSIDGVPGDAIGVWNLLNQAKDGGQVALDKSGTVKRGATFAETYAKLEANDVFAVNYGAAGHVGIIMSTAVGADGQKMVQVLDGNHVRITVDGELKTVEDGMPRRRWMTINQFRQEYVSAAGGKTEYTVLAVGIK